MFETILTLLVALKADRRGVTAVEYGLIAVIIAVTIVKSAVDVGTDLKSVFTHVSSAI